MLAACVIVSHVYDGSKLQIRIFHNGNLGTIAVYGFFGISGYLIARSAEVHGLFRFLWLRAVRIFPGFWVALVLTAYLFGVVAWMIAHHGTPRQSLGFYFHPKAPGFFLPPNSPFNYLRSNFLLQIRQVGIAGIIKNSSLWTLYYEFLAYLILGGLAVVGLLRRRLAVAALTAALFAVVVAIALVPGWDHHFNVFENWIPMNILKFMTIFMVGTLCYLFRDRIPDSGWLALGLAALAYGSLYMTPTIERFAFQLTITHAFLPLMVYPVLWLGAHLPFRRVGVKNDYSYGVYLYGFPVQMVVVYLVGGDVTRPVILLLTLLGVVPFALFSWWAVERNALRLKGARTWDRLTGSSRPPTAGEALRDGAGS